jgi:hypothetical protein
MAFPYRMKIPLVAVAMLAPLIAAAPAMAQKKPNIVMLMTDDTGWNDFGAYTGGGARLDGVLRARPFRLWQPW